MRVMRLLRGVVLVVALAALVFIARPYVHGLSFVIRAADMRGVLRRLADLDTTAVHEREIVIPTTRRKQ